jgi:uncharacterized membrane protein (UPF0127 family)
MLVGLNIRWKNLHMRHREAEWPGSLAAGDLPMRLRSVLAVMAGILVLGLAFLYFERQPQSGLAHRMMLVGNQTVHVEVASTPSQIRKGLMHRRSLEHGWGMLFELGNPQLACFWMKDTHVPLTAGFIDDAGVLVQLVDLDPMDRTEKCSQVPVVAVLEMPQGWFARHHVHPGHMIDFR